MVPYTKININPVLPKQLQKITYFRTCSFKLALLGNQNPFGIIVILTVQQNICFGLDIKTNITRARQFNLKHTNVYS